VEIADFGGGRIVLRDVFFASIFFSVRGTKTFLFAFAQENSPVQPLTLAMVVYGGVSVRLRMTPATSNDVVGRTGTMMVNTWRTVCKGTGTAECDSR
jgi:hypothetical protein